MRRSAAPEPRWRRRVRPVGVARNPSPRSGGPHPSQQARPAAASQPKAWGTVKVAGEQTIELDENVLPSGRPPHPPF